MRIKALDAPNEVIKKGWQYISAQCSLVHNWQYPGGELGIIYRLHGIKYHPGRFYAHMGQEDRLWSNNRDSFEVQI